MEIKAADVAKLRQMTGAGMMDCKKALVEAEGDYERAKEIIREKGKLVAAKRADRETSEGAVIAKVNGDKAIIVGLGCETDFVAKNAEFQALAEAIAEVAIANFPADKDALMACVLADGRTVEAAVTEQTGKPMIKLDVLKDFAKYLRNNYPQIKIRINTNGHANAIHKRDVLPELKGLIDEFSISLNGSDENEYNELSQPKIQNGFNEVKDFIKKSVENGFDTTATMVSGFTENIPDIKKGQKIAETIGAKFRVRDFIKNGY